MIGSRLHEMPDQSKRRTGDQRNHKQVGTPEMKRRIAVIHDVYSQEKEKPQTTDNNHEGPDVPQQRQHARGIGKARIDKYH